MEKEIWKDIPGYEDLYQISTYGRVKNKKRNIIKKNTLFKGYYITKLGKNKVKPTHRLVAITFLDKKRFKCANDENRNEIDLDTLFVNHKDENPLNNNVNNLEWCTNKYNVQYSAKRTPRRKKYKEKIDKIADYVKKENIDKKIREDILNIILQ